MCTKVRLLTSAATKRRFLGSPHADFDAHRNHESPVGRLFWNEFYFDVTRVPELRKGPKGFDIAGRFEVGLLSRRRADGEEQNREWKLFLRT